MLEITLSVLLCKMLPLNMSLLYGVLMRRSSHRRCSLRKGVLRNFTKFTGIFYEFCEIYLTPLRDCFVCVLACFACFTCLACFTCSCAWCACVLYALGVCMCLACFITWNAWRASKKGVLRVLLKMACLACFIK